MNSIALPDSLLQLQRLVDFDLYIVGGFLRDSIAGFCTKDIDICGSGDISTLIDSRIKVCCINKKLGTSLVRFFDYSFEYTRFRFDNYTNGNHNPDSVVFTNDIQKDCNRRDFACNAVYYNIRKKQIVDFCDGVGDINKKILREVNKDVFYSDGLRILRLIRFASETGFEIESSTKEHAINNVELLKDISANRLREEFEKILFADKKNNICNAHIFGIKLLYDFGIFECLFFGIGKSEFDIEIILNVLKNLDSKMRFIALLYCMYFKRKNVLDCIIKCMKKLMYSNRQIEYVVNIFNLIFLYRELKSDSDARLFVAKNIDYIDDFFGIYSALKQYFKHENFDKSFDFIGIKNSIIRSNTPLKIKDLKINGDDCNEKKLKGKDIAIFLNNMLDYCIINPEKNTKTFLIKELDKYKKIKKL